MELCKKSSLRATDQSEVIISSVGSLRVVQRKEEAKPANERADCDWPHGQVTAVDFYATEKEKEGSQNRGWSMFDFVLII